MEQLPNITLVGTGRIATQLSRRMKTKGIQIRQVIGRDQAEAAALAIALNCKYTSDWAEILPDTDWVILAVSDDAIVEVAGLLSPVLPNALFTHTSGATPGNLLAPYFKRFGVFYPLQSFSKSRQPIWSKIPICVDASNPEDLLMVRKIAKIIGNLVYQVNDQQRAVLHIAAVFANNFANHCFTVAEKILEDADLPFEMLHPLMEETVAKAMGESPEKMQTGPAQRGDVDTINRHQRLLADHPGWRAIYQAISEDIMKNQPDQL